MRTVRNKKGQSMVEYALGIGCVAAVCMVAFSELGHISGDIFLGVQSAINYGGAPGLHGVADTYHLINANQTPANLQ